MISLALSLEPSRLEPPAWTSARAKPRLELELVPASPVQVLAGDCLEVLKTLAGNSIDAVVTDPPYHLTSIVKRFGNTSQSDDNDTGARVRAGADGMARLSRGFMGKIWDGGDISQNPALWSEILRVLKPGGHCVAFSGTRTYHRMACAIEDAGFEVRDQLAWTYGQGFPKSLNVGDGWGTALKPAYEPICLARKPLSEKTVAANVLRWGTGAINVGACRVNLEDGDKKSQGGATTSDARQRNSGFALTAGNNRDGLGRFPANLCHDGSQEVLDLFPESKGQQGDVTGNEPSECHSGVYSGPRGRLAYTARNDSGSAARFFYCAKASKADRANSKHPTVKPIKLMQWLCRLVTPLGGIVLDPFAGSGTTGAAAILEGFRAILIEREDEYVADIRRRLDSVE